MVLAAAPACAREFSPYVLMSDPLPANPASRPGHFLVIAAGPVAADAQSTNWSARQVAELLRFFEDESAEPPAGLTGSSELRVAMAGRASLSIFGIGVSYSPVVLTATGSVSEDLLEAIRAQRKKEPPAHEIDVGGTGMQLVGWEELAVRGALGVPVLPRLLGLRGLVVGGSVHWIKGHGLAQFSAEGKFSPTVTHTDATLTTMGAERGSGLAYDVGFVAELNRWLSVEGAYVGAGQVTWEEARGERTTWSSISTTRENIGPEPLTYQLPASTVFALRVRPIWPVELLLGYARIGVNKDDGFGRLNGEVTLNLPVLQPALGLVQDDGQPSYLYGKLRLGIGGTAMTVKVVNLQGVGNPEEAKTLGLSATVSLGF